MWALHIKYQQEAELAEYITNLGGTFPFEQTEEENRMRTEVLNAMQGNDANTFQYTRAPGTGLRAPHTKPSTRQKPSRTATIIPAAANWLQRE